MPPDQLGFQGFEERFHGRIIIAVSFSAHRHSKALIPQAFLIVVTAILTASVCVVNASRCRLTQIDRHVERADRKVLLHTIANGPLRRGSGLSE